MRLGDDFGIQVLGEKRISCHITAEPEFKLYHRIPRDAKAFAKDNLPYNNVVIQEVPNFSLPPKLVFSLAEMPGCIPNTGGPLKKAWKELQVHRVVVINAALHRITPGGQENPFRRPRTYQVVMMSNGLDYPFSDSRRYKAGDVPESIELLEDVKWRKEVKIRKLCLTV